MHIEELLQKFSQRGTGQAHHTIRKHWFSWQRVSCDAALCACGPYSFTHLPILSCPQQPAFIRIYPHSPHLPFLIYLFVCVCVSDTLMRCHCWYSCEVTLKWKCPYFNIGFISTAGSDNECVLRMRGAWVIPAQMLLLQWLFCSSFHCTPDSECRGWRRIAGFVAELFWINLQLHHLKIASQSRLYLTICSLSVWIFKHCKVKGAKDIHVLLEIKLKLCFWVTTFQNGCSR